MKIIFVDVAHGGAGKAFDLTWVIGNDEIESLIDECLMRTIHKFAIELGKDVQILEIPADQRYLHVEYLIPRRCIFLWVEVPADITAKRIPRRFRVFSTGDGIPDNGVYVGTCIDQYLPEAYHVYELQD